MDREVFRNEAVLVRVYDDDPERPIVVYTLSTSPAGSAELTPQEAADLGAQLIACAAAKLPARDACVCAHDVAAHHWGPHSACKVEGCACDWFDRGQR